MTFETLLVEVRDGIATVTLNRPEARNALNRTLVRELGDALDALDPPEREALRVLHKTIKKVGEDIEQFKFNTAIAAIFDFVNALTPTPRDAELLVAECSVADGHRVSGHLTPRAVGRLAAQAAVSRLVVTHFYPSVLALGWPEVERRIREEYRQGPIDVGGDGLEIEL